MRTLLICFLMLLFGATGAEGTRQRIGLADAWRLAKAATPAEEGALVKSWLESKTLWFNLIVMVLLVAEANIDKLQGYLPDDKYKLAAFGLPIINSILRFISIRGLSFTLPGAKEPQ